MAGYFREQRVPWTVQPQVAVGINAGSDYAQNLALLLPLHPSWGMRDLVSGRAVTKTGLSANVVSPIGVYPSFGTANYLDFIAPALITSATQPMTIAWDQYPVATSAYSTILSWKPPGAANNFAIYLAAADATYYFVAGPRTGASAGSGWSSAVGAVTNGRPDNYVLVMTAGTDSATTSTRKLFKNGVLQARGADATFGSNAAAATRVGALDSGGDVFEGGIGNFAIWAEAFSDAKAANYFARRFAIYQPLSRRIWVPVSAGGGTTIIGALGTATASGLTGTADANTTLAGALGTATATGFQGTVSNSTDTTISGALGTAVASGLQGGVNANTTIPGALGVAVASGLSGTVSNTNDTVIAGSLGTATAEGLQGAITWNRYIAGVLGVATAEGLAGTVRNGSAQAFGGGIYPTPRRRTKKEIEEQRRELGILPPEEVQTGIVEVPRKKITLAQLIGKTAAAQVNSVDLSIAVEANKRIKRRRDDEFLLMM